jgi:hypothetical protein
VPPRTRAFELPVFQWNARQHHPKQSKKARRQDESYGGGNIRNAPCRKSEKHLNESHERTDEAGDGKAKGERLSSYCVANEQK